MHRLIPVLTACALLLAAPLPAAAALKPGDAAPDFTAQAFLAGKPFTFRLSEALRQGPVVVYFFPAAYTPGCNVEAALFSQAIDRFKARNATVVGVTAGNAERLAEFSSDKASCAGKFAVAADPNAQIAKRYDAQLTFKPGWSNRTSYVIAPSGKVVSAYTDAKPNAHVRHMLDGLDALQGAQAASPKPAKAAAPQPQR